MLGQLLEFINNLSIDEKLYWRVTSATDKQAGHEIFWRRAERPKPWSLKRKGEATAEAFATKDFAQALADAGVDTDDFERQLGVSVLTQAVFADMVLQAAMKLFGAEVVTRSINDTRAFLASVSEMAQTHAGSKPGTPSPAPQRTHLKLVTEKLH
jgi:hypothetical protein